MIKEIKEHYVTPESTILKIGSIYTLTISVTSSSMEKTEILYEGTPVKIISIYDEKTKRVECVDYRGVHHFINSDYLSTSEIEKYPHRIKIKIRQLINFFAGEQPQTFLFGIILGLIAIISICLFRGTIVQINKDVFPEETEELIIFFSALNVAIGILKLITSIIGKNLLYTKENLKELKILFNQKGAKNGSEAFTNDKGE